MKIKSVPKVNPEHSEKGVVIGTREWQGLEGDVVVHCGVCDHATYIRPESAVIENKWCIDCFKQKLKSGEISKEELECMFTDSTRKELSNVVGREVSVGEMVDMIVKACE